MLEKIKLLLGLQVEDGLLQILIDLCTEEAINYTNNSDISAMESCICSMVVYQYNRLGSLGVDSESYSGVRFDYATDYPKSIIRQLKSHRKLILV